MPMRQAAQYRQPRVGSRRYLIAQQPAHTFDLGRRPVRQIGQGSALDLAVLPIALPQQIGWGRVSVGYPRDVHALLESNRFVACQEFFRDYMPTKRQPACRKSRISAAPRPKGQGNFGLNMWLTSLLEGQRGGG